MATKTYKEEDVVAYVKSQLTKQSSHMKVFEMIVEGWYEKRKVLGQDDAYSNINYGMVHYNLERFETETKKLYSVKQDIFDDFQSNYKLSLEQKFFVFYVISKTVDEFLGCIRNAFDNRWSEPSQPVESDATAVEATQQVAKKGA